MYNIVTPRTLSIFSLTKKQREIEAATCTDISLSTTCLGLFFLTVDIDCLSLLFSAADSDAGGDGLQGSKGLLQPPGAENLDLVLDRQLASSI